MTKLKLLAAALTLTTALSASATTKKKKPTHKSTTTASKHATTHSKHGRHTTSHAASTPHAAMESGRATQIQQALINNGYMSGTPSGTWDAESQAAMQKLQHDNGWQTKIVPDSRAIIKLGLGPQPAAAPQPH